MRLIDMQLNVITRSVNYHNHLDYQIKYDPYSHHIGSSCYHKRGSSGKAAEYSLEHHEESYQQLPITLGLVVRPMTQGRAIEVRIGPSADMPSMI